jgi:hypothetical protein
VTTFAEITGTTGTSSLSEGTNPDGNPATCP